MPKEQFDINRCTVGGIVQKIWGRDNDIFLRLIFLPDPEKPNRYLTTRLPGGTVNGKLVSLQPGDRIRVSGYLSDEPYTETIREFLWDARKKKLQNDLGEKLEKVRVKRIGTRLDVLELERLKPDAQPTGADVSLQGVIVKTWESGTDLAARLGSYDPHTEIISNNGSGHRTGRKKWPRRKPHYITIRFLDGKADGQPVRLKKRNRIRLSGSLQIHFYKETLRDILIRAQAADLIGELDGIDPDHVFAIRSSAYVVVNSAIVLASLGLPEAETM